MSTWQGISHARMTRSMQALPGGAHKVLTTLRRLIPDGARRKISQAEIARRACVSEGTVSSAMHHLDGPYLVRHSLGRGRGRGYEIELLPPPEQRPPVALSTPSKGSISDPCDRSLTEGSPTPPEASPKGSEIDPSIFSLHAHEQQQQQTAAPFPEADRATGQDEQAAQLAPATVNALQAAGAHPKLIARVAANNPTATPADVATALAMATAKPNAHTPPGLALECLALRQQVVVPRPREEPAPRAATAAPPRQPPRPPAAPPATEEPDDPDDPDDESPLGLARRALPPDAPTLNLVFVAQRINAGATPAAAVADLEADLTRRGLLLSPPRASPPRHPRPEDRVVRRFGQLAD
jgi:hypothetical protein